MEIEKLTKHHKKESFDCGNELLNIFLKKYAIQNQYRYMVGVTYVITKKNLVLAFITLSASSIKKHTLNAKKPYEDIPVLRVARLAVDKAYQNKGFGKKLLKFALLKALKLKEEFGCVGIVVDVKEEAVKFYEKFGFIPVNPLQKHLYQPMYLSIKALS